MVFQREAMPDIDDWVRHDGSDLLFIYGENDPARAKPFPSTSGSHGYLAPDTNHLARIADLTPADRTEAIATLERWAGRGDR